VFAGGAGRLLEAAQRLSPSLVDWYLLGPGRIMDGQRTDRPDDVRENMDRPTDPSRSAGRFAAESKSTSLYTTVFGLHPARGRVAVAAALGAAAVAVRRAGRRR
jgi:hypothetical protein